jgi:glycerophosphoryl diester phosphodiesterase
VLIAHRGSSGAAPENTLAAFRRAASEGAEMVELDVRLSRDGALVVFHDRRVRRITSAKGSIRDLTLAEIRALDAGSWRGAAFRGERIPLLSEVFGALPGRIGVNVEVKTDGDRPRRPILARALCGLLRAEGRGREVVISSFDRAFLRRMRSACPGVRLGLLSVPVKDAGRKPSSLCRSVGASVFICSRRQLRKRHVLDAQRHGLALYVYGVNRPEDLARVLRAGVDGVMTDDPKNMRHRIPCP